MIGKWETIIYLKTLADSERGFRVGKKVRTALETYFLDLYGGFDWKIQHMLRLACDAGAWLTSLSRRMNGTKICILEFMDALQLCYNFHPLKLEMTCNGYSGKFSVDHAMSGKLGGLLSR